MVVFLGIHPGQMPEEPQPEGLDPFRDWQAACSAADRLVCSVSGVWDPKDFPQTPGVEGVKALSQGLGDRLCLAPVEQDWEDVCPVEVHLDSCVNMGPPDIFFKEAEVMAIAMGDRDASQYLSLTSPVV